ncbi:MAG: hypothetical protein M3348_08955, partial [Acidobacteriota bacterium]|nr:hypothetical protein [Acidobacteriota bacterium]
SGRRGGPEAYPTPGAKMTTTDINPGGESGGLLEQVFAQYRPRLQRYFLVQLGDEADADACARETVRLLLESVGADGRGPGAVYVNAFLMRTAFALCLRKQRERD